MILAAGLALASPGRTASASTPSGDALPRDESELLLVGDSVTAGVYYLSLNDESVRQAWAGQLMLRLGLTPDSSRLEDFHPLDHLALTRKGLGVAGLRYPWEAFPALFPKKSRFELEDERTIVAVPGQMVHEVVEQSSDNKGKSSSGWTFARIMLPEGYTAIETIEAWTKRPRWIVLFIGANDLLASFGIVGPAESPSPEDFARDYERLALRLRATMSEDAGPDHLLLLTVPDETKLPFIQPLPPGSHDGKGNEYPPGSMASAFLIPFRENRFHNDEVWTPEELEEVRRRLAAYNAAITDLANREGFSVVRTDQLLERLGRDPEFASPNSPYFSPDLHHPSHRTHSAIADLVLSRMAQVATVALPAGGATVVKDPLPTNADFDEDERRRVDALMRLGTLGLAAGPLPPEPTFRLGLDAGIQAGESRAGDGTFSVSANLESNPSPVHDRWLSRGTLLFRGGAVVLDESEVRYFPRTSLEFRGGVAVEPIGNWHWMRFEGGLLWAFEGGLGWYGRGEWRIFYAEVTSRALVPDRFEAGVRLGWLFGRGKRWGN
jgi:lysophospholipase L1-like esterase